MFNLPLSVSIQSVSHLPPSRPAEGVDGRGMLVHGPGIERVLERSRVTSGTGSRAGRHSHSIGR